MFKPIKGFEELYSINEEGVVKSVGRNGNGFKEHIMTSSTDSDGYKVVKLRNKNKVITKKIHRMVAEVFLDNPDNKPQINHKDGNKANNHISNLEWVTASENIRHAKDHGLQCECPNRVKVAQKTRAGQVIATYQSLKAAEIETGIHWTGISAVIRGVRKTAGGFIWERI